MKKTRRFVALLLTAVLALALFTACCAAQPTIGEEYEKMVCRAAQQQTAGGQTGAKS